MNLTSKPLAVIILVTLFGGIFFSSIMGWWATESTKEPITFTEGEFAGEANPADIRGSYTFGDIANSFDVTPELLAQAFGIVTDDPASFAVKDLETIYLDSGYEIGTASVRVFVAFYSGLPYDLAGEATYLPRAAADILLAKDNLDEERLAYLESFTVDVASPSAAPAPVTTEATKESSNETYTIKGKTTFGELIAWGLTKEIIEGIIGLPMPDPAMTIKDFASANGLDMETIKAALQAEVDKLHP